ncbi:hypothetical protein DL762_008908 [Monosporascus cannonballus]|uniref:Uncharacterized protein n=1 Tax=Monosporascus cannonballus TaxID=155416 RepID=A0ABY0GZ27_9PEZI|nr:hypothetical protein DL762_008908 [Monosporascus cannonballus]
MLPPVDDAVLKSNPDFERVYRKVTGVLLNPDGSTRNDALAKKREAVRERTSSEGDETPSPAARPQDRHAITGI